jgi:PAS domain S-box-containing protein
MAQEGARQGEPPALPSSMTPPGEPQAPFEPVESARPIRLLRLIGELSRYVGEPERFQTELFDQAFQIFEASVGLFFQWNEETKEWVVSAHRGMPRDFGKNGQIPRAWQSLPTIVTQEGGSLFSGDMSKDSRFVGQIIKSFRVKSFAGVSLKSGKKVIGVLGLGFGDLSALTPSDEEALRQVASVAGTMLHGASPPPIAPPEEEATGEVPEKVSVRESINWITNLDGRVLAANEGAQQFLGYSKDQLLKLYLSDLVSKKDARLLLQAKGKRRRNSRPSAPVEVELNRQGRGPAAALIRVERVRYHGRPAFRISAQSLATLEKTEMSLVQKSHQLDILENLASCLGRAYSLEEIFGAILSQAIELAGFDGGYILRFDERKQRLFLAAQKELLPERINRLTKQGLRREEGAPGQVMKTGEPYHLAAGERHGELKKKLVGEEGLLSYVCIPVPFQGQVWGTLSIFSRSKLVDRDDLRWLTAAARAVGYAVENAQLFEDARLRVDDLTIMNEVSQSITRSLHLEVLFGTVVDSFTRMINATNCFILLIDDKRNLLYGVAATGRHNASFKKTEIKMNENSLAVLTVKERRPFAVENAPKDPRTNKKLVEHYREKSLLSVPLIIKEKVIGVVMLDETRYYRNFTDEEIKRVMTLANQVSVAIENATLYQAVTKHVERLQSLSSAIVNIQEEERRRIARELHDETGHALTGIKMNLETIEKELLKGDGLSGVVGERINDIKSQVLKTTEELRRLSYDLRPAILDDLGLVPTLRWYVENFQKRTGTSVHLQVNEQQKRFPPKIETLLYRVIQEALTNVAKHAQAESVAINLERKDMMASLYITDDGKGFEVRRYFASVPGQRRCLGILGMKERVELSGGTFFIDSEPGEGTRISIRVPIMKRT